MTAFFQFLVIGLGAGAVYAALGTGVVLTYQAAGVVNVALGAVAAYVASTYAVLAGQGDLILPIGRIHTGVPPTPVAVVVALGVAALIGLVAHGCVFRPLRGASGLSRLVASVGVLLVLESLATLRFAAEVSSVSPVLPSAPVHLGSVAIPRDRFWLVGCVVLVALALWAATRMLQLGLATRAVAEDERGAALLGYSPALIGGLAWVASSVVAGLLGILAASITGLDPATNSLLIVPGLAAALLGRLRSFGTTVAVGLALGAFQSEVLHLQAIWSWLPQTGVRESLPFVVIIIALVALGGRLPTRGSIEDHRLPAVPRGRPHRVVVVTTLAVTVLAVVIVSRSYRMALTLSVIDTLVALSIVVLTGMLGQISLAQMTFAGTGGFVLSNLAARAGVPFPVAPILAVAAAVVLGVLAGLPALRIRGVTLGVVTLGLGVAVTDLVFKNSDWTGGLTGAKVPGLSLFGWHVGTGADISFALVALALVTVGCQAVGFVRGTRLGSQMRSVRANERAAAAGGVNVAAVKLAAFGFSAGLAGVAGVLLGYQQRGVSFQDYDVFVSLTFVAVTYFAGITTIGGAVLAGALAPGGIVFYSLQQAVHLGRYSSLVSALGLLAAITMNPGGLVGAFAGARERLGRYTPGWTAARPRAVPGQDQTDVLGTAEMAPEGGEHAVAQR